MNGHRIPTSHNILDADVLKIPFPAWMGPAPRANASWTAREENQLNHHYNTIHDLDAIARIHGRTREAIEIRLEMLIPGFSRVDNEMVQIRRAELDELKKIQKDFNELQQRVYRLGQTLGGL